MRLAAEVFFDGAVVTTEADNDLAAIAPRRRPSDLAAFQQHDGESALRRFQRGGQTGEASADDADVGFDILFKRWIYFDTRCRCRVIVVAGQLVGLGEGQSYDTYTTPSFPRRRESSVALGHAIFRITTLGPRLRGDDNFGFFGV